MITKDEATKFAYWKYDVFPFYLCAPASDEVVLRCGEPATFIPAYGATVTPFHMEDLEDGECRRRELVDVEAEYEEKLAELLQEYRAKALDVAPFLARVSAYGDKK